jgi:hypothetical protein
VTRVVDIVDEKRLCEMAFTAAAAQLAKMIAGFRTASVMRSRLIIGSLRAEEV